MRLRAIPAVITALFLAGLGVTARHDLTLLAWRQGTDLLRAGDYRGALALLGRADRGTPRFLPVAFNAGVARYRLGDFQGARERFAVAAASDDPLLRGAARYNLGNCAFRQGERLAVTDREAARRLFQEAAREYRQALAISPGAADARHNLAFVGTRLADQAGAGGRDSRSGADQSGDRAGNGAAQSGTQGKEAKREGESSNGTGRRKESGKESGKETAGRSPGDRPEASAQSGKAQQQLTSNEAERLLNEARGREAISASLSTKGDRGRLARPEKDW